MMYKKLKFAAANYLSIELLKTFLAYWGALWGATEGVVYVWAKFSQGTIDLSYKVVLFEILLSLALALFATRPFKELSRRIPSTDTRIIIRFGNIWEQKGDAIIAVTRSFTMQADDVVISRRSIHGQYVQRAYANWHDAQAKINAELAKSSATCSNGKYEVGTTIYVSNNLHAAHLVAITDLNENNRATVSADEYFLGIAKLWSRIAVENSGNDLICPIIGAGFARLQIEKITLLANLIKTASIISQQTRIANNIIFIIRCEDVICGDIKISDIQSILDATVTNMKFSIPLSSQNRSQTTPAT